jgi:hypothetical protein
VRDATIGDKLLLSAIVLQFISLTVSVFVFEQQFENQISVQTVARNISVVREFLFFALLGISVYLAGDGPLLTSAVCVGLVAQYIVLSVASERINGGPVDIWSTELMLGYASTIYRLLLFLLREITRVVTHGHAHDLTSYSRIIFLVYTFSTVLLCVWGVNGVMTRLERAVDTAMRLFVELPCAAISPPLVHTKSR